MGENYFKDLFEAPENYREGDFFRATNCVFPVRYRGEKYVVKKPKLFPPSFVPELYYVLQDLFFHRTKRLSTVGQRFSREVEMLKGLEENAFDHASISLARCDYVPYALAYDKSVPMIIREYIEGRDFRILENNGERMKTLHGGAKALDRIHCIYGPLGNVHVKNLILDNSGEVYWTGLSGVFRGNRDYLKELDFVKFIYSTWVATKDLPKETREELILFSASSVPAHRKKDIAGYIPGNFLRRAWEWFPTRMPVWDDYLHKEIKQILK